MKATLEFNLPEEQNEFTRALLGPEAFSAIHEVLEMQIRPILKYGEPSEELRAVLEKMRSTLIEVTRKVEE